MKKKERSAFKIDDILKKSHLPAKFISGANGNRKPTDIAQYNRLDNDPRVTSDGGEGKFKFFDNSRSSFYISSLFHDFMTEIKDTPLYNDFMRKDSMNFIK